MENLHTHTYRCNHAKGEDRDYVVQALGEGFSVLGFSEHTPWPFDYSGRRRLRMTPAELEGYANSVRSLKNEFKDRIDVRLGLEVEAFTHLYGWLGELIERNGIEYLILGNHYTQDIDLEFLGESCTADQMPLYVDKTRKAFESGFKFKYMAHPDLIFCNYPSFDESCISASKDICALAMEHNMPLEYNLMGEIKREAGRVRGLGYPTAAFWDIAGDYDINVYVGLDAHAPWQISSKRFCDAAEHLKAMGFNVINA